MSLAAELIAFCARTCGLNVKADNVPALKCYGGLGFAVVGEYEEFMVERA